MSTFKPLAQTRDTVTLKRADFDALLRSVEDSTDLAAVDAHRAYEDRVGWDAARRNYLTPEQARRLLNGESPVRVWREKRGMKQRTLAEAAVVAVSYLAEIEGGKKPGSSAALQRIANVLEMPLETLIGAGMASPGLEPVTRAEVAARRLVALAEQNAASDRMANELQATVDEWSRLSVQHGWRHQVRSAIEAVHQRLADATRQFLADAVAMERDGDHDAAKQKQNVARALGAALDAWAGEHNRNRDRI